MTCSISSLGVYVRRGFCTPENRSGFCPGGFFPRGLLAGGILSRGDFVLDSVVSAVVFGNKTNTD